MSSKLVDGVFISGELPASWRVSSRTTGGSGNCVEVGPLTDGSGRVGVRHSHHPGGTAFVYGQVSWNAFVEGAKTANFDFSA